MKGMYPLAKNPAMVMDLYELTMANGYFKNVELHETKVAFDVFFRRIPDGGGFAIFAGLEQIVDFIENGRSDVVMGGSIPTRYLMEYQPFEIGEQENEE